MSDAARAERLASELESAFRNRADLYRLMLEELTAELGAERAEAVMVRALARRRREGGAAAIDRHGTQNARGLGAAILAVSPDGGRMYPVDVERRADGIAFQVRRCPLKDAWVAAGVGGEDLARLCRIAGAFDRGLFEATGVRIATKNWTPE